MLTCSMRFLSLLLLGPCSYWSSNRSSAFNSKTPCISSPSPHSESILNGTLDHQLPATSYHVHNCTKCESTFYITTHQWITFLLVHMHQDTLSPIIWNTAFFDNVVVVVYPLPWPLLVGGVRCSRLWFTSQLLRPSGQQCSHSGGVCPQIQGRQCGAYVGAVEEMMCVVCVDVTEGA